MNSEILRSTRFGRRTVDDVAAGEQRERAEARAAAQKQPARRIGQELCRILDEQLGIDAGNGLALRGMVLLSGP